MSRGAARKAVIARVALGVFLERGFAAATMDDVAEAAGASKQTLYRFFGDRDGLVRHVLEVELESLIEPLVAASDGAGGAAERLERLALAYQDMIFSPVALTLYRYVLGAVPGDPGLGIALTEVVTDRIVALVAPLVADVAGLGPYGVAGGTGADAADALADAFLGAVQGKEFNRALAGYPARPDRLAALRASAMLIARG